MISHQLWRITQHASLDGGGGLKYSARWNTAGHRLVYLAESPAGALIEALVHLELEPGLWPANYLLLCVEISAGTMVAYDPPPGNWRDDLGSSRAWGDAWLAGRRTALARVPSAILPFTNNILLNPSHPDAAGARIVQRSAFVFDPRL